MGFRVAGMKRLSATVLSALLLAGAAAASVHPEKWYQEKVATEMKGRMEARVENGRVDVLTDQYAIEVEFAAKWKNAIGQALWYALQTGKKAGIVIVLENEKDDLPAAIRLGSVIEANKLPIRVWIWPRDFAGR